jgi:hypothetical protein
MRVLLLFYRAYSFLKSCKRAARSLSIPSDRTGAARKLFIHFLRTVQNRIESVIMLGFELGKEQIVLVRAADVKLGLA